MLDYHEFDYALIFISEFHMFMLLLSVLTFQVEEPLAFLINRVQWSWTTLAFVWLERFLSPFLGCFAEYSIECSIITWQVFFFF